MSAKQVTAIANRFLAGVVHRLLAGLVELDFSGSEQLAAAQRTLDDSYELSRVNSKLVVASDGSVADMADMFIRLNNAGLEPAQFTAKPPTLDDVFFKILPLIPTDE